MDAEEEEEEDYKNIALLNFPKVVCSRLLVYGDYKIPHVPHPLFRSSPSD